MKKLIYILIILITFSSCSEYQSALKTEDIAAKYNLAVKLYEAGKFDKASRLFQQILPKYRGKPQAERLRYLYAKSLYAAGNYPRTSNVATQFIETYPESEKVSELAFLAAKGYYFESPVYSKEQEFTATAVQKLQGFINQYPDSEYTAQANKLVKELDFKLEEKAFNIAKQYNIIGNIRSEEYTAAITSLNNFLFNYPGSSFKEEALFIKLDSAYKLASNSVAWKKEERVKNAITNYSALKKAFPESKYIEDANKMNEDLNKQLQEFNTKS